MQASLFGSSAVRLHLGYSMKWMPFLLQEPAAAVPHPPQILAAVGVRCACQAHTRHGPRSADDNEASYQKPTSYYPNHTWQTGSALLKGILNRHPSDLDCGPC